MTGSSDCGRKTDPTARRCCAFDRRRSTSWTNRMVSPGESRRCDGCSMCDGELEVGRTSQTVEIDIGNDMEVRRGSPLSFRPRRFKLFPLDGAAS